MAAELMYHSVSSLVFEDVRNMTKGERDAQQCVLLLLGKCNDGWKEQSSSWRKSVGLTGQGLKEYCDGVKMWFNNKVAS